MRKKYSISLVTFAYNEEDLLENFICDSINKISRITDDFEIILVNDGSADKTEEIALNLANKFSLLKYIKLPENKGVGFALIEGLKYISKDIVFWNDVDAHFNADDLPQVLKCFDEGADIVLGNKINKRYNFLNIRSIMSFINFYLIKLLFLSPLNEFQFVQFYKREIFDKLNIQSRSTFIISEILFKSQYLGYKIKELPLIEYSGTHKKASGGKCLKKKIINQSVKDIWKFWFKWNVLRMRKSTL